LLLAVQKIITARKSKTLTLQTPTLSKSPTTSYIYSRPGTANCPWGDIQVALLVNARATGSGTDIAALRMTD